MVKTRLSTFEDVREHLRHLEKEFEKSTELLAPKPGEKPCERYFYEKAWLALTRDLLAMMEN